MIDINYLYEFADENNIKIIECDLGQAKGLCLYDNKKCNIYINSDINTVQKKCVLAEEVAHYCKGIIKTDISNKNYNSILNRSINEFRALKWVTNKLIPLDTFKQFFGQDINKFEIAQKLDVTEDLVEKAYYIYEDKLKGCNIYEEKV